MILPGRPHGCEWLRCLHAGVPALSLYSMAQWWSLQLCRDTASEALCKTVHPGAFKRQQILHFKHLTLERIIEKIKFNQQNMSTFFSFNIFKTFPFLILSNISPEFSATCGSWRWVNPGQSREIPSHRVPTSLWIPMSESTDYTVAVAGETVQLELNKNASKIALWNGRTKCMLNKSWDHK